MLIISVVISALVIIVELKYIGETSLASVIIGLAIAIGLQAVYLLKKIK